MAGNRILVPTVPIKNIQFRTSGLLGLLIITAEAGILEL
jgi:hypothetical protein